MRADAWQSARQRWQQPQGTRRAAAPGRSGAGWFRARTPRLAHRSHVCPPERVTTATDKPRSSAEVHFGLVYAPMGTRQRGVKLTGNTRSDILFRALRRHALPARKECQVSMRRRTFDNEMEILTRGSCRCCVHGSAHSCRYESLSSAYEDSEGTTRQGCPSQSVNRLENAQYQFTTITIDVPGTSDTEAYGVNNGRLVSGFYIPRDPHDVDHPDCGREKGCIESPGRRFIFCRRDETQTGKDLVEWKRTRTDGRTRCARPHPHLTYCWTAGRVCGSVVWLKQDGCPNPLVLVPVPPPGFGVMS